MRTRHYNIEECAGTDAYGALLWRHVRSVQSREDAAAELRRLRERRLRGSVNVDDPNTGITHSAYRLTESVMVTRVIESELPPHEAGA